MRITTVENKIVVKRLKEQNAGSVFIPDSAKEKPIEGTVVTTGPDVIGMYAGNHIMFNPSKATTLEVQGEEFIVVEQKDVFIVIGDNNG